MRSSGQFRDHVGHLGGDGDVHVAHVVDLLLGRVVELEEEHDVRVLVEVLDPDFRCFRVGHLDEEGPRADGVGDLGYGPVHLRIEVHKSWPKCLNVYKIYR